MASFNDLPTDILILIFPYLQPRDFLALCSTCQSLSDPSQRNEPSYWRYQTQAKFRVPNRPAVQADGLRWQKLYKRLRTQSRVYTWGQYVPTILHLILENLVQSGMAEYWDHDVVLQDRDHGCSVLVDLADPLNTHGCLGRDTTDQTYGMQPRRGAHLAPRIVGQPLTLQKSTWPQEMGRARDLGVISDLQCGGWSTSLLTDDGIIYTVGVLNGMAQWNARDELTPLEFDELTNEMPKEHTTIKQFSSGRRHVLGLADDGTIWSWGNATLPACAVSLANLEGSVTSVHAGWDRSSALLRGCGIVVWEIVRNGNVTEHEENDYVIIPKTGYQQPRGSVRAFSEPESPEASVGEVTSYVVLEHYVLFTTHLRKVFAYRMRHDSENGVMHDIFEITELADAKDVQGGFRTFAVFCGEGEVYISNQEYLDACSQKAFQQHDEPLPELMVIPAMQNTGVMQVAFGDYHYHALHSDGTISSYGHESGGCGALGLGGAMDLVMPHGVLRGIKTNGWTHDGVLLPHAYSYGRRVWFQEEQKEWIRFLANGGKDYDEAKPRLQQVNMMPIAQAYMSEWVEQNGSGWDKRPEVQKVDEDGLGAYFALSVAAAGWHSGALVLVNDKVVDAVRESCLETIPDATPSAGESSTATTGRSGSSLWDIVKSFFGFQGDSDPESRSSSEDQYPQSYGDGSPPRGKKWIWANQDFPRLLLDYNFMAPGTIQHSNWIPPEVIRRFLYTQDERKVFGVPGWIREESESFVAP